MGGTEIYAPLEWILERPPIDGYLRQVFLLTDGEVYHVHLFSLTLWPSYIHFSFIHIFSETRFYLILHCFTIFNVLLNLTEFYFTTSLPRNSARISTLHLSVHMISIAR